MYLGAVGAQTTNVFQKELNSVIGYIRQTMDFEEIGVRQGSYVDRSMGLYKTPRIKDVISNWEHLVNDPNKCFEEKCREIGCILAHLLRRPEESISLCKNAINVKSLLPSDDKLFCLARQLCLNSQVPIFTHHFHRVNNLLTSQEHTRSFLENCGVVKTFTPATYVRTINGLETARNEEQLRNIRSILELIRKKELKVAQLPDCELQFHPVEALCLDDYNLNYALSERGLVFCHPDIPHELASYFGVKTKRSMIECLNSDSTFEPFSQREDICGRLKRIAESYSNPLDVFKELIQNADDSRAKTIHFILDLRTAPESPKVVNIRYEKLLAPALLVFNDSCFTTNDIRGLEKLGKGSKTEDADKIGKFGVGFNCVYGLSDYPCFLTQVDAQGGGNFCLLDPSCEISETGGQKININPTLLLNYPDTFGCFLREKSELNALQGKTMFRFPLRRESSDLGDRVIDADGFLETLTLLSLSLQECLLFLRNVNVIKVSRIGESGILHEIKSVSRTVSQVCEPNRSRVLSDIAHSKLSFVEMKENGGRLLSKWLVSYHDGSTIQTIPQMSGRIVNLAASVAYPLKTHAQFQRAQTPMVPGIWCFLPLEEASAQMRSEFSHPKLPVAVNASFILDESRKLLSLTRNESRGAWNSHLLLYSVAKAYAELIMHLVRAWTSNPGLYSIETFLKHLPSSDRGGLSRDTTSGRVNSLIAQGLLNNLRNEAWIPQLSSDKLLKDFRRIDDIRNLTSCYGLSRAHFSAVYKISEVLGFFITQLPSEYMNCLKTFNRTVTPLKPLEVLNNLANIQFQRTPIENSVFESLENLTYFLDWSVNELPNYPNIDSLPIFLTANGYLQRNNENRLYSSTFSIARIFPALKDRIIHHEVNARLPPLTATLTVAEFFELMNEHFPDLCKNQQVIVEERKRTDTLHWVELVWKFLSTNLLPYREAISQFSDDFSKLSILMTQNQWNQACLHPVSARKDRVFVTLPQIIIGPVGLNLKSYESFYELVPELSASCKTVIRPLLLSHELFTSQQINVLHMISTEENRAHEIDQARRVMLYRHFMDIFTNSSDQFDNTDFARLRDIPIFSTITGQVECLSDVLTVFSIPNNIPRIGFNLVSVEAEKYVVQESAGKGAEFQQKLGIITKTVTQIYAEAIILKLFEKFNFLAVDKHLEFLANFLELSSGGFCANLEASCVILPILKLCKFLEKGNEKKKASDLFDFKNFLFKTFRSDKLIDPKYEAHLPLLRLCGLNHKISRLEFEGMIADHTANIYGNGYRDNAEILRVFGALMCEFYKLNLGVNDFKKVSSLAMFETLCHGFRKLDDVYVYQYKDLVEYVAPVLTFAYSEKLEQFFPSLGNLWEQAFSNTQMKPSPSLVLDNLTKLLRIQNSDDRIRNCIKYIVIEATRLGDQAIIARLSSIACIPALTGNNRLAPRNVCKTFRCDLSCGDDCNLHLYVDEPSTEFLALWDCLKKLGASDLPTLQQKVYALAVFYQEVSQGSIWTNNPNVKRKYEFLERHLWFHSDPEDFSHIKSPIYLVCKDGTLRNIHECVIIDNFELYQTICSRSDNSQNSQQDERLESMSAIFPFRDAEILKISKGNPELLFRLPPGIRPKFFNEICRVSLDQSTFDISNSTVEQFDVGQFEQKKSRPEFCKNLAHVIDAQERISGFQMPSFSTTQRQFSQICRSVKNCIESVQLKPVKCVKFTYTLERGSSRMRNTFEKDFHYISQNHTILFTYPFRTVVGDSIQQNLKRLTASVFYPLNMRLDSEVVQILSELIFISNSIDDENQVLRGHGIETAVEQNPVDLLIGKVVPANCYAIIDRDPYRQFKENELVAVTRSNPSEEQGQVYLYAKFIEPVLNDSNVNSYPMVKLQTNSRLSAELLSKNKVFGFLEKLPDAETSNAAGDSDERTEDEFQRDVEKLNQIIWTAALARRGSLNLNSDLQDLERRIISSILQKYVDPERQRRLISSVEQAIRTQIEAERASGDQETSSSINSDEFDAIPHAAEEFLLFHCERMQEEIASHREQMQTAIRTSRTRRSGDQSIGDAVVDFHLDAIQSAQPHPVLARLWLCQAKEHMISLDRLESATVGESAGQDWKVHIIGKV